MDDETHNQTLLEFFKALADPNRLKIVGFLAQRPTRWASWPRCSDWAFRPPPITFRTWRTWGWYRRAPRGTTRSIRWISARCRSMARRLLQTENLPRLSQPAENDTPAYDRKVLATFLDPEGRIIAFPAQEKKFLVLLRHVLQAFEPGVRYAEKQVNEILSRYNDDTASLRRGMIEYHLMQREGGGGAYWRTEEPGR